MQFTFQYGEIKRVLHNGVAEILVSFTFQYGEIKRLKEILEWASLITFTFQYGEIKSRASLRKRPKGTDLHSSMERLKVESTFAKAQYDLIYIPVWRD